MQGATRKCAYDLARIVSVPTTFSLASFLALSPPPIKPTPLRHSQHPLCDSHLQALLVSGPPSTAVAKPCLSDRQATTAVFSPPPHLITREYTASYWRLNASLGAQPKGSWYQCHSLVSCTALAGSLTSCGRRAELLLPVGCSRLAWARSSRAGSSELLLPLPPKLPLQQLISHVLYLLFTASHLTTSPHAQ